MVSLKNGGDLFLTGGKNHNPNSKETNRTLIYRMSEGKWMQAADMPTPRHSKLTYKIRESDCFEIIAGMTCGAVLSKADGPVSEIVVAGGVVFHRINKFQTH